MSWLDSFPGLKQLPRDIQDVLTKTGRIVALPKGTRIYEPGQAPRSYLLLIEGSIRVQQSSESGREIVLYRVAGGETCMLTTACLIGHQDYLAEAIAETDIRAVTLPAATFDDLIARSPEFRRFVFAVVSARVTNLFRIIDEVAFARFDIRLAQKLIELADGDEVTATQQQLASELGSAREVVSRTLGEFQRRGWVMPGRGSIAILDRRGLERLAGTP